MQVSFLHRQIFAEHWNLKSLRDLNFWWIVGRERKEVAGYRASWRRDKYLKKLESISP